MLKVLLKAVTQLDQVSLDERERFFKSLMWVQR
jgi:hypothetical protein